MNDDPGLRQTPLEGAREGLAPEGFGRRESVRLAALAPLPGQLDLRGAPDDAGFRAAARGALGFDLPTVPNTVAFGGNLAALWLGPDEWLIAGPFDEVARLAEALKSALQDVRSALVDVSAARTVLELTGPWARDVLEKGCPLDLHPRAFGPGRCAQTVLARAQVVLEQTDETPAYRLFVRASFARYLAHWLADAMAEYL